MTQVLGNDGPAVLLLPGGAEAVDGFFPGLGEGLLTDPVCRVVLHDRPGTVGSEVAGGLRDAADDLHATIADLDVGPVVVVGQSLGGAVAMLLAQAHPDDVAGLVLLDPTPVNDERLARQVTTSARVFARLSRLPGGAKALNGLLRRQGRRSARVDGMAPDVAAAMDRTASLEIASLDPAVDGLVDLAAAFDEAALPRVPAVVVTADRKPTSAIRRAHQRVADALGAPLVSWPRAEHAVHLTHPAEVLKTCRDVVRESSS